MRMRVAAAVRAIEVVHVTAAAAVSVESVYALRQHCHP